MIKITIQHGKLLEPFFNFYVQNSPDVKGSGWKEWASPDKEKLGKRIQAYKDIWAKYEEKVLNGIYSALDLSLKENIDVYIVAGINRDMSSPVIISSHHSLNKFVVTLAHELIHRLLASNKDSFKINNSFLSIKGNNDTINSHVLIFSVLRKIFEDEPEMFKMITPDRNEDYIKAYELSEPYEEILRYFRNKV